MAQSNNKLEKTISEAERVERTLDSITKHIGEWADVFERIDARLGELRKLSAMATETTQFPKG